MGNKNIQGSARIKTVKLADLRVSSAAQREFNTRWGAELAENFDIDMVGTFTVSYRDGIYWIVDGQHRYYGLVSWAKENFGSDWDQWTIQVWAHEGLNEKQEAKLFLSFNNRRQVNNFDKFRVGVTAGLPVPTDIDRVVRLLDLRVDRNNKPGSVSAVGTLEKVYTAGGAVLLRKTLEAARDAWDGSGFDANALHGIALFINRYEGRYDADRLVKKLAAIPNGARGLKQRAAVLREQFGGTHPVSHAAAITEFYNRGLRGKSSLGSWWKASEDAEDVTA